MVVSADKVCIVVEDSSYIYGVFGSEEIAREDYGEMPSPPHTVEFLELKVHYEAGK
jgi:hypothetical protein